MRTQEQGRNTRGTKQKHKRHNKFFVPLAFLLCFLCSFPSLAATTTLLDAAESGDRATALRLLAGRADPNVVGQDGTTAVMYAASNDDLELVRALIKAGANVK